MDAPFLAAGVVRRPTLDRRADAFSARRHGNHATAAYATPAAQAGEPTRINYKRLSIAGYRPSAQLPSHAQLLFQESQLCDTLAA
jgi:hypothetical protein